MASQHAVSAVGSRCLPGISPRRPQTPQTRHAPAGLLTSSHPRPAPLRPAAVPPTSLCMFVHALTFYPGSPASNFSPSFSLIPHIHSQQILCWPLWIFPEFDPPFLSSGTQSQFELPWSPAWTSVVTSPWGSAPSPVQPVCSVVARGIFSKESVWWGPTATHSPQFSPLAGDVLTVEHGRGPSSHPHRPGPSSPHQPAPHLFPLLRSCLPRHGWAPCHCTTVPPVHDALFSLPDSFSSPTQLSCHFLHETSPGPRLS